SSIREQQPGVAYGMPSSNFRSCRRSRAAAAGVSMRRRYIICCTAVERLAKRCHAIGDHAAVMAIRRSLLLQFLKVGHRPFASAPCPNDDPEHDPEKWLPDFAKKSCSTKGLGWNDDCPYGFSQLVIFRGDH